MRSLRGYKFRPVPPCSVLFRPVLSCSVLFRPVPSCSVLFRHVPSCSVMFRRVLSCSVVFRRVPSCSVVFRRVPSCSVVFRHVPSCSVKHSENNMKLSETFPPQPPIQLQLALSVCCVTLGWQFRHVPSCSCQKRAKPVDISKQPNSRNRSTSKHGKPNIEGRGHLSFSQAGRAM